MNLVICVILLFIENALVLSCATAEDPGQIVKDLEMQAIIVKRRLNLAENFLLERSEYLNKHLFNSRLRSDEQLFILLELRKLEQDLAAERKMASIELAIFRYKKGIEVLKMIFEKILSLDHHFTSLNTYRDISALANPNSFPEFIKFKDNIKSGTRARNKIDLPAMLDNNTLFSMGYALVYSFFGSHNKEQRNREINEISCLLDFTLTMQSDLKIIYYETDFLRMQNDELRHTCLELFKDYMKIIGYEKGLEYCRNSDDWDMIFQKLNTLEQKMLVLDLQETSIKEEERKALGQLMFNVELLMEFAENYARFIYQGEMYYRKFLSILSNYEHRGSCLAQLPVQYEKLESEISQSIEKFDSAYNIAELRGSKLRELMFGVPEN